MVTTRMNAITNVIEKRWRASQSKDPETLDVPKEILTDESQDEARGNIPYESGEFESDMQRLLELQFPFSCLPGIQIYSPRKRGKQELGAEFGAEIDHLLHFRLGGTDYLVVVEVKMQPLEVSEKGWRATYTNKETGGITKKCAKKQVDRQIQTLWEYIRPVASKVDLKFLGLVVSVDPATQEITASGYEGSPLALLPVKRLVPYIREFFNLDEPEEKQAIRLMVSQSPFLSLLRMSCPLAPLGHPELKSAICYVDRCRRSLDESIYKDFEPTKGHWAINGSAGMGKSVLLAYTAAVLCSGYRLHEIKTGENYVGPAKDTFGKIGFKDDKRLSIGILAMSTKQLDSLRFWFQFFVECFQEKDEVGQITFRKPEFLLVRTLDDLQRKKWSALLVDECHDIHPAAERVLVEAYKKEGFFLVVACDRHQKLRYSSNDSRILNGLDFGKGPHGIHTKRLRQNYRNPTPINIASLALMFRWFADGGHKVLPTKEQLSEQFGFAVEGERSTGYKLKIQTDAHPANAWAHTVASFPDAHSAYRHLRAAHLPQQDVLWVRFCDEDQDFDYETLGRQFIYHVCRSVDAQKINDKYIKGQDYPVVVIEGFPRFMDQTETPDEEEKMWSFRRELYLCASRASCFLYLIANVRQSPEVDRIQQEIRNLVNALSVPSNYGRGGTKIWEFVIAPPEVSRNLEFFQDNMPVADADTTAEVEVAASNTEPVSNPKPISTPTPPPTPTPDPEPEAWDLWVHGPITLIEFADEVGKKPFQIMAELIKMNVFLQPNSLIEIPVLEKLTESFGGTLQIFESDPESDAVDEELPPAQVTPQLPEEMIQPVSVTKPEASQTSATDRPNLPNRSIEEFSELPKKNYAILDLLDNNAVRPRRRERGDGADSTPTFMVGPSAYIRAGRWIEERNYGLGKVLVLNTRPGYADSHHVWFEKPNAVMRNYPLRGRVSRVIDESRIPPEIQNRCPQPLAE
jgi:hypothetical protein